MNKTTVIASAVAFALGVGACSEQKSLEQLLASANEYSDKRDFSGAIVELKNAVRIAPKNAQARLALGLAYIEQGNYIFAEKELERAVQLGVEQASIAPVLAQVKARLAKTEAVYQLVESSSELNDDDYIAVLTYAGIVALSENDKEKAQDYIGQAIAISESATYSKVGKAYLAQSTQDYVKSLAEIESLLEENPNFSEALLLKAHLLFALEDYEKAAASFTNYLKQHPMDYSIHYFEVNSLIKAKLYEQAEVITDTLLAKFENAPLALHYKAQLQYQKGMFNEAKINAEQAIQAGNSSAVTKLLAGASAYQLKDYEQAYNYLIPIENLLPNSHPVRKIIAVVKLQLGYDIEAADSLVALEGLTMEDSTFLQASTGSLIEAGDFESAQKLIAIAEKIDPDNAELSAKKGFILLSQKNNDGIQSLERAIELDPSLIEVDLALGIQYLKTGDDKQAQKIADKLIVNNSDNPSGYMLQGVIYTKTKDIKKAFKSFEKSLSLDPKNIASLYNLAILFNYENDFESSMRFFEKTIKVAPTHKGALAKYVSLAVSHKQLDRSRDFLQSFNHDNNLLLLIALVQNLRLNKQTEEAISLLEGFSDKEELDTVYWSILGDSYLSIENIEKADAAFASGIKLSQNDYLLNLRRIGTLETLKNYPSALSLVKKMSGYYPQNERLLILHPYLEMRNKNLQAAKKALTIARNKQLNHNLLDFVAGHLALRDKDFSQAVDSFSAAYEFIKNNEHAVQLSRALKFNGQQEEAEKVLENFVEVNPTELRVRFILAELYGNNERYKKVKQYLVINEMSPNNPIVLNNLAWNQYKLGQMTDSLKNLELAHSLAPKHLAIVESYGVVLEANQKYEQAVKVLELAISLGSKDKEVSESLIKTKLELGL